MPCLAAAEWSVGDWASTESGGHEVADGTRCERRDWAVMGRLLRLIAEQIKMLDFIAAAWTTLGVLHPSDLDSTKSEDRGARRVGP